MVNPFDRNHGQQRMATRKGLATAKRGRASARQPLQLQTSEAWTLDCLSLCAVTAHASESAVTIFNGTARETSAGLVLKPAR